MGENLGSWGRAKKAGERGKEWGKISVVGGERKKRASEEKRGDSLGSWGERKKRASEEKRGETVSVVGASEKSGRESEEPICHNSYLVLESYTYSYAGRDTV